MLIEEVGDLSERLLGLGYAIVNLVLRVRRSFEPVEIRHYAGPAELPMHTDRIAEQQVSRACRQNRRWETMHVPIDRREQRILQVMTIGVNADAGVAETVAGHQDVVDLLVGVAA